MNTLTRTTRWGRTMKTLSMLAACASLANATTIWDLKKDWSDAANPNGPWSLNEGANALPFNTRADGDRTTPQPGWTEGTSGSWLPFWFRSNGTETFSPDTLAGDIVMHSTDPANGAGNGTGNVTWTSPITGAISISGGVWMARDIGRSNQWRLFKNATLLSQGTVSSGDAFNRANPFLFTAGSGGATAVQNVSVTLGDVIKLEIERGGGSGDYVGVNFKISAGYVWNTGLGANGHTYIPVKVPAGITWQEAENAAVAAGGHLVSIGYAEENAFVYSIVSGDSQYWFTNGSGQAIGPWLGGYQSPSGTEPAGGWQWTDGYGFDYTNWAASKPDNGTGGTEDRAIFFHPTASTGSLWDDYPAEPAMLNRPKGYIIEIGPGEGSSTVWNTGPGANGHSYQAVYTPGGITWPEAEAAAQARGGHLASINSADENAFVYSLVSGRPEFWYLNAFNHSIGPFIGGFQPDGSPEPGGGFQWSDGTPFIYTNWRGGEPNNSGSLEKYAHLYGGGTPEPFWNDVQIGTLTNGYIIEYTSTPGVPTGPEFADMLYIASGSNNVVHQYRIDATNPPTLVRSLANGMNVPAGLALAPDNELFVVMRGGAGAGDSRLDRYLSAEASPVANGSITPTSPALSFAHGVTFRGNDLLVVDSWNNTVRRFQPNAAGVFVEQLPPISAGLSGTLARYVGVNPSTQEVFVSLAGSNDKLLRYLISSGGAITSNGEVTGNGLDNPHDIAFAPWGEMFVTNYDGHSVSRFLFDAGGAAVPNGVITGNDLSSPVGLAFSPWGELFAVNTVGQKVSRFTFSETGAATANGTFSTPTDIGVLRFVRASAPTVPAPCVPGVTTSVTDGLIGWWKGDGNADDFTGNNHGTEENGVTYEPGRFGQAFRVGMALPLGPNGARVNIGHLPQLKGAAAYTVSAWLKVDHALSPAASLIGLPLGKIPPPPPPPSPPGVAMGGLVPSNGRGLFFTGAPSYSAAFIALGSQLSYSAYVSAVPNPPGGSWRHIVGVWRSSDGFCAVYFDGLPVKTGQAPVGVKFPDGTEDFVPGYIGAFPFTSGNSIVINPSTPCLFDDVRIYTRDLTPEEILLISTGEDFNTCPPPNTGIPTLAAARVPAGVRCSWPSRFTGWTLETSLDLITWTPVIGTPAIESSDFAVTTAASVERQFFRLRNKGN